MAQDTRQSMSIGEAAVLLGVSTAAVRKRVRRGKLPATKQDDGTWTVHISPEDLIPQPSRNGHATGDRTRDELVTQLRGENAWLRAELQQVREERAEADRRRDILFSQFTERIEQLSATTSRISDAVVDVPDHETSNRTSNETVPQPVTITRPTWWQRLLGIT